MSEELLSNDRLVENYLTMPGFESLTYPEALPTRLSMPPFCYDEINFILATCPSNKKSVITFKRKFCKKDQHVYNNYYELGSRAINNKKTQSVNC